jgi:uncharacterized protein HemY
VKILKNLSPIAAALKQAEEERDVAYARIQAQQYDIDAAEARVETLTEENERLRRGAK